MYKKGYLLVSMSSVIMQSGYLEEVSKIVRSQVRKFHFIFLDELELINQRFIYNKNNKDAVDMVDARVKKMIDKNICNENIGICCKRWGDITKNNDRYIFYEKKVRGAYENNSSFKRCVINQTFKNLQPIFNSIGVENKKHKVVESVSDYIIKEISLKLLIGEEMMYDIEFGPWKEMEIMRLIYSEKYSACFDLQNKKVLYKII